MPVLQPGMRFGMPQSEKLEFQGDQDQSPVLGNFRIMFSQGRQFLMGTLLLAQSRRNGIDSLPDPLFQKGKKNLLLAPEIGVERAACIAGPGSNVFEASGLEAVAGKNFLGGGQKLSPGCFGSFGLPGMDVHLRRYADAALCFLFHG